MLKQNVRPGGTAPERARSFILYSRGQRVFPAGVTRATVEMDPIPIFLSRGEGAYVVDVDGNWLLDLNNNFTSLIHGHGFAPMKKAVSEVLHRGTCFANPMEHEIALAELLVSRIPAIEKLRFVNSGTEAVMYALKAARAYTGRSSIVRFEGAYHGGYDWAEAGQNSVDDTIIGGRRVPRLGYAGAPKAIADTVIVLDFNDAAGIEAAIAPAAGDIAAILVDPMPSRAGLLQPTPDFMAALTATARRYGIVIIADEVLNLRQGYAGASARYGLEPDLVVAGKIIGGGFPVGAVGGRADIMAVFGDGDKAPLVSQGGTFSANPVTMVAGRAAMEALTREVLDRLEHQGDRLRSGLTQSIARWSAPFSVSGNASLFRIHPKKKVPSSYREALMSAEETVMMRALSRHFLEQGILLPFGAAACLSTAMTVGDIDRVVAAFDDFLAQQDPHEGGSR